MAQKFCTKCGTQLTEDMDKCPNCGAIIQYNRVRKPTSSQSKKSNNAGDNLLDESTPKFFSSAGYTIIFFSGIFLLALTLCIFVFSIISHHGIDIGNYYELTRYAPQFAYLLMAIYVLFGISIILFILLLRKKTGYKGARIFFSGIAIPIAVISGIFNLTNSCKDFGDSGYCWSGWISIVIGILTLVSSGVFLIHFIGSIILPKSEKKKE